jgi:hypothetical protein
MSIGFPAVVDLIGCEAAGCNGAATFRCSECALAFCPLHQGMEVLPADFPLPAGALRRMQPSGRCESCQDEAVRQGAAIARRKQAEDFARREAAGPSRLPPAQRRAAYEKEVERWEASRRQAFDRLASVADPHERLLLAIRHWVVNPTGHSPDAAWAAAGRGSGWPSILCIDAVMFSRAFPHFWSSPESVQFDKPSWDSVAMASWFAKRAKATGVRPHEKHHFKSELRSRRGWWLESSTWRGGRDGGGSFERIFVDTHGNLVPPDSEIGVPGLYFMAGWLGIEDAGLTLAKRPQPD